MARVRSRLLGTALLGCFATFVVTYCTHPVQADSTESLGLREDSSRIVFTQAVKNRTIPAGEMRGIVVDAYHGFPLAGARVSASQPTVGPQNIVAVTDSYGHFRLTGLPRDAFRLLVIDAGYVRDTIHIDGRAGYFTRFALVPQRARACGDLPVTPRDSVAASGQLIERGPRAAITVIVRDSRTNVAPVVPVTLQVRDHAFSDSARAVASDPTRGAIELGAAHNRDGIYEVDVTAAGYAPWHLKGVRPELGECGRFLGRRVPAWLIPTS